MGGLAPPAGQRGEREAGVLIHHLRGSGWLHPGLKGHSSCHLVRQLFPQASLRGSNSLLLPLRAGPRGGAPPPMTSPLDLPPTWPLPCQETPLLTCRDSSQSTLI